MRAHKRASAGARGAGAVGWMRAAGSTTLALGCAGAMATEGGGNSYPVGVETNYNGMMLPEGPHGYAYYAHYGASHFKDAHDIPAHLAAGVARCRSYFMATSCSTPVQAGLKSIF